MNAWKLLSFLSHQGEYKLNCVEVPAHPGQNGNQPEKKKKRQYILAMMWRKTLHTGLHTGL